MFHSLFWASEKNKSKLHKIGRSDDKSNHNTRFSKGLWSGRDSQGSRTHARRWRIGKTKKQMRLFDTKKHRIKTQFTAACYQSLRPNHSQHLQRISWFPSGLRCTATLNGSKIKPIFALTVELSYIDMFLHRLSLQKGPEIERTEHQRIRKFQWEIGSIRGGEKSGINQN